MQEDRKLVCRYCKTPVVNPTYYGTDGRNLKGYSPAHEECLQSAITREARCMVEDWHIKKENNEDEDWG